MSINDKALHDVRRKIAEKLNKDDSRLVFGYRGEPEPTRHEGDVWEDIQGKRWTIKNGIRQNITKLDDAKTPWFCPKCNNAMGQRFDVKFWRIRGMCTDCVIVEETKLRAEGRWQEVSDRRYRVNYIARLRDYIQELEDYHTNVSAPEFIHADDHNILMIEKWDMNLAQVKADIFEEVTRLKSLLKSAEEEHEQIEERIRLDRESESAN
jgi:hypothetical protein